MRCHFCFTEGDVGRLTKEHLLSKPVAEAFGLDRSALFGQLGADEDGVVLAKLSDLSVRFVCERCNSTWMNALEHRMAAVAEWTGSPHRSLSPAQVETLRAWSLKTYQVLSVMVGEVRRFVDNPDAPGVLPNLTRARHLYQDDQRAFDGMAFGLAKPYEEGRFAYAFGNPTVVPRGPRYASVKSAGIAIVTLGPVQVWTVDPTIFHAAQITFPRRVTTLKSGVDYSTLRGMPLVPDIEEVTVDNGEHDVRTLMDQVEAWARRQPS